MAVKSRCIKVAGVPGMAINLSLLLLGKAQPRVLRDKALNLNGGISEDPGSGCENASWRRVALGEGGSCTVQTQYVQGSREEEEESDAPASEDSKKRQGTSDSGKTNGGWPLGWAL